MEGLVRRRERADNVVVDVAVDDRVGDLVSRGGVAPVPPTDQDGALRVRCRATRVGERRREHERHRRSFLRERLEPGTRLRRGGETHDLVVARVPLEQLALDLAQARCVPVDGEQRGSVHGCGCYSAREGSRPPQFGSTVRARAGSRRLRGQRAFVRYRSVSSTAKGWPRNMIVPVTRTGSAPEST